MSGVYVHGFTAKMAATLCEEAAWEQFNAHEEFSKIIILDTIKFHILYRYWPTHVILAEFEAEVGP